MVKLVRRKNVV